MSQTSPVSYPRAQNPSSDRTPAIPHAPSADQKINSTAHFCCRGHLPSTCLRTQMILCDSQSNPDRMHLMPIPRIQPKLAAFERCKHILVCLLNWRFLPQKLFVDFSNKCLDYASCGYAKKDHFCREQRPRYTMPYAHQASVYVANYLNLLEPSIISRGNTYKQIPSISSKSTLRCDQIRGSTANKVLDALIFSHQV